MDFNVEGGNADFYTDHVRYIVFNNFNDPRTVTYSGCSFTYEMPNPTHYPTYPVPYPTRYPTLNPTLETSASGATAGASGGTGVGAIVGGIAGAIFAIGAGYFVYQHFQGQSQKQETVCMTEVPVDDAVGSPKGHFDAIIEGKDTGDPKDATWEVVSSSPTV